MMDWANLITTSRLLATPQPPNTQPLQDSLRRAGGFCFWICRLLGLAFWLWLELIERVGGHRELEFPFE